MKLRNCLPGGRGALPIKRLGVLVRKLEKKNLKNTGSRESVSCELQVGKCKLQVSHKLLNMVLNICKTV